MMAVRKFQAGDPKAVGHLLHRICRGLPPVEVPDQRDMLRGWCLAEKTYMVQGSPSGAKPGGNINDRLRGCGFHILSVWGGRGLLLSAFLNEFRPGGVGPGQVALLVLIETVAHSRAVLHQQPAINNLKRLNSYECKMAF